MNSLRSDGSNRKMNRVISSEIEEIDISQGDKLITAQDFVIKDSLD